MRFGIGSRTAFSNENLGMTSATRYQGYGGKGEIKIVSVNCVVFTRVLLSLILWYLLAHKFKNLTNTVKSFKYWDMYV